MNVKYRFGRAFQWKVWHLYLMAGVASLAIVAVIIASVIAMLYLRGLSNAETKRNAAINRTQQQSIQNLKRIQALEKPPTQRQLSAAALDALLACSDDPKCRAAFRNTVRRSRIRPSDVPALRRRLTPPAPSGGGGGSSTPTPSTPPSAPSPSPPAPGPSTPTPRRPATRHPRPAPAPRPPASTPSPPNPAPSAPPAQPTPSNPLPVPVPPVPPGPPVNVPPVPGVPPVCVPPIGGINCPRDSRGRINGANPDNNSGSGNTGDPDCERYGFPCPPGLVRLPVG